MKKQLGAIKKWQFIGLLLMAGLLSANRLPAQDEISVFDIISGGFASHSPAYYEHVIAEIEPLQANGKITGQGRVYLSEAYARTGQGEKAISFFREAMQGPESATGSAGTDSLHLGRLYAMNGDYAMAAALSRPILAAHGYQGYDRSWLLQMQYLAQYGQHDEAPVWPHFNGAFGEFLLDSLGVQALTSEKVQPVMRSILRRIAWDSPTQPVYYELLGDLLMISDAGPEMPYLAAFAYQRASQLVPPQTAAEEGYRRKAIFAMEGEVLRDPRFYNKVRYADMENAFKQEQEKVAELQQSIRQQEEAWATAGKDMEMAFLDEFGSQIPPLSEGQELQYWPRNGGPALDFTSKEVENQRNRSNYTVNDEVTNPSLDIQAVKKDYRFNMYALLVIGILIGAVAFIWRKFRQMEKERDRMEG